VSQAELEASEANLRVLEANLSAAKSNISGARESAKAAEYGVESSQATLSELRTSLRRTTIYAPMGGVVSLLNVEQGERVVGTIQMTGTELMRIANLNAMEVRVEVSENDVPTVKIGNKVEVEVDAYLNRTFTGGVDILTKTAEGIVSIPIEAVTTREKEVEDKEAAGTDNLQEVVFVVSGDTVRQQVVTTGIQDANVIQVTTGLEEGDQVASTLVCI